MPIPTLATGWVVGAVYHAQADGIDAGLTAEAVVNVGTITFTPTAGYHLPDSATAVTHGTITAMLDSHGDIHPQRLPADPTGSDTEDGISLPVGGYKVTYTLTRGVLPSHQIVVTEAHTVGAPLALFESMAEPTAPGTPGITATLLAAATGVHPITLTGNLALTVPAGHPADQVYRVAITQPPTGGPYTVTYDGQPVSVDTAAGASTLVELHPLGAGRVISYPVTNLDAQVSALTEDGGSALNASLSSTHAAGVTLPVATGMDDTTAIQAVLTAHAGKRIVGRPGSAYKLSAPLTIGSGTTLDMTGCSVTLLAGSNCQMLRNTAHANNAGSDTKIAVIGGAWDRGASGGTADGFSLMTMVFERVAGLTLRDIYVSSTSGKYCVYLYACTDFALQELTFASSSDGVHMTGTCARGVVSGVYGTTGDDSVAITTNDYANYVRGDLGDVSDILIERVHTTTTANLVKVLAGSAAGTPHTLRNIVVRQVAGSAARAAVHLGGDPLQANTFGGVTESITLDNIRNSGVGHAVVLYYSTYRDITLRRIYSPTGQYKQAIYFSQSAVAEDITIDSCYFNPPASTYPIRFNPNAAQARVTALRVTNCRLKGQTKSAGLIDGGHASAVLAHLYIDNLHIDQAAWGIGDFYQSVAIYLSSLRGVDISGWANIRAGASLDVRGASGIHANVDNWANAGTLTSRSLGLRGDVSTLARNVGDMAYNTNGALGCGVGPVAWNGTAWQNLATAATYAP